MLKNYSLLFSFLFSLFFLSSALGQNVMLLPQITAEPGDEIVVELEIINETQFRGFQTDIPLPEGFSYVEGSIELNPDRIVINEDESTVFRVSANLLSGNVLRVMGHNNFTSIYFTGNEGPVAWFSVQASNTPGVYPLMLKSSSIIGPPGTGNILTGTVDGEVAITGEELQEYTLTINVAGNGNVTVNGNIYTEPVTVNESTTLSLNALPGAGWVFEGWSGDITGTNLSTEIGMNTDKQVTATFVESDIPQATLTLTTEGNGSVQVDGATYIMPLVVEQGTVLDLQAIADPGWAFDAWSGDVEGTNPSLVVTMDQDKDVVASFIPTATGDNIMRINDRDGEAGSLLEIELEIVNEDPFIRFQADILLPDGFGFEKGSAILNSERAEDHFLTERFVPETNTIQLEALSLDFELFKGNEGPVVFFSVQAPDQVGDFIITLTDASITSVDFEESLTGTFDGTITLGVLEISVPDPVDLPACTPADDIQNAYNDWTAGFYYTGGSNASDNISDMPALPEDAKCQGASLVFTYIVEDDFGTISGTSTFDVSAPEPLQVKIPTEADLPACTPHADIEDAYDAWVAGFSFSGDCNTTDNISEIPALPVDVYCQGASLQFTYVAQGDCGTISGTSTFDVAAPQHVVVAGPEDVSYTSVEFENQDALDKAFNDWLDEFSVIESGCAEELPETNHYQPPLLHEGGTVTVVYSLTDSCTSDSWTASFSLTLEIFAIDAVAEPAIGGAVSGAGNYNHFEEVTLTANPVQGYHFVSWTENGIEVHDNKEYKFIAEASRALVANFAINVYTIEATAGDNGTIDPVGLITLTYGESQKFSIAANQGYHIDEVLVDNQNIGDTSSFTFVNITKDHTIHAIFALNSYTLIYSADANGTIAGDTQQSVLHGGDGTEVAAVPNTGHHFVQWSDGLTDNPRTDLDVTGDLNVTAQFALNTYTITSTSGANGSISPLGETTVEHGDSQTYAITPLEGYHVSELIIDDLAVDPAGSYTFGDVTRDHTIHAEFALNMYVIVASAGDGGSISPEGDVDVAHGANRLFTIAPDTGYHIEDILVDNVSVGANNQYTFVNITKDHTIHAIFALNTYTLIYSADANGTIAGDTQQNVLHGGDGTEVEAVPSTGHHFVQWSDGLTDNPRTDLDVTGDLNVTAQFVINTYTLTYGAGIGGTLQGATQQFVTHGGNGTPVWAIHEEGYHFTQWSDGVEDNPRYEANVSGNLDVVAEFTLNTYTIHASAGENGTISPEGETIVEHGGSQTYTISPANGYHVSALIIDGNPKEPAESFTFEHVSRDHTIHVEFALNTYVILATTTSGGNIDPEGEVGVNHGDNQSFSMTPDQGYHIEDIFIDGVGVGPNNTYTFVNITKDHSIHVVFAINTYTLIYIAGEHGSLHGDTEQHIEFGGSGTPVGAVPDPGYHFVQWSDGVTDNPRTDSHVVSDLEVVAAFALTTYKLTFIVVDENGAEIPDAVIALDYGDPNEPGDYEFTGLLPGTYTYEVDRAGYFYQEGEVTIVDDDVTVSVEMVLDDTSIEDPEGPDIQVYPNPAVNIASIGSTIQIKHIRLISLQGQVVYSAPVDNYHHEIDVSVLLPGTYFVQAYTDQGVKTMRLQVMR